MHPGAVDRMGRKVAVERAGLSGPVWQAGLLRDEVDHIHAKAVHALIQPEAHHVVHALTHIGVLPVQVGLLGGEQVQVILAGGLVLFPRRAAEAGAPVVGQPAVFSLPPDVVIPVGILPGLAAFHKPRHFIGGVVDHQIHQDPDAALMRLGQQLVKILHGAELVHDGPVVGDVVAVVVVRRAVDGVEPDHVGAQPLNVVKPLNDTAQIADPVAVGVHKGTGIDLINDRFFPPCFFHSFVSPSGCFWAAD